MCLYTKQLEQFSNANENSLTFIVGEKGVGKSFFIHNYYKNFNHILYIKDEIFKSYFLEPITSALTKFDDDLKIENYNIPISVDTKRF